VPTFGNAHALETRIGTLHRSIKDRPVHVSAPVVDIPREVHPENSFSPARALVACLTPSDRTDGLFATVVVDEVQTCMGLVYSSKESICASVGCLRGVYWSRSRGQLWRKGDTSGAVQALSKISLDCDSDALKFSVYQQGEPPAFCHQNTRTCWGEDGGIPMLFRTLESRKKSAPPGSYTARLFSNHDFLRDKLLEEAQELAEAVKGVAAGTDSVQHVVAETADVLYFALTACVAGGGSLGSVAAELDLKALKVKRRQGDAKEERKQAADARLAQILEEKKQKLGNGN